MKKEILCKDCKFYMSCIMGENDDCPNDDDYNEGFETFPQEHI